MRNFYAVLCFVAGFFIACGLCRAADQDVSGYALDPVVVYPGLTDAYARAALRNIQELEDPADGREFCLDDSLRALAVVDLQRRGPFSLQSDLRIRGSNFEQTDVFVDGIKVNDPQTGHFNLDIPFFIEDMEKILVVPGASAGLHAAGGPGGSVHIATKKPRREKAVVRAMFGENNFSSQTVSMDYFIGHAALRSTAGRAYSGDYRLNTDFDTRGFSQGVFWDGGLGEMAFNYGILDKEFGANGFYSEFYPLQFEQTNTVFSSLGLRSDTGEFYLNPQIYVRRHKDRFLLDKTRPAFFENLHTNYVTGAKLDLVKDLDNGRNFFGIDSAEESIDSTGLGKHQRMRNTLYAVFSREWEEFSFSPGLSGYFYDDFEDYITPEINLGYRLNARAKLRSSFSQSVRVPTFTELFYQSPANIGNSGLAPEKSNNYESGIDFNAERFSSGVTFFYRRGKNIIDWVREKSATVYQAANIAEADTLGWETQLEIYPESAPELSRWDKVFAQYVYTDVSYSQNDLVSKYVSDYLVHKFVLGCALRLPLDLRSQLRLDYLQREDQSGDLIAYADFSREIRNYTLFLKIDNLFNHAYAEKSGIPLPGRWVFAGVSAQW